jgi:hypothetical protein
MQPQRSIRVSIRTALAVGTIAVTLSAGVLTSGLLRSATAAPPTRPIEGRASAPQRTMPMSGTVTANDWAPGAALAQAWLPAMDRLDTPGCRTDVAVQSMGDQYSKLVLVVWGEPGTCTPDCAGPLKVECSALLKPGTTWHFLGAQIPAGSVSGAIFSFTAQQISAIAPGFPGDDDVVADYMCEALFFGTVGDCGDYRRFKHAFDNGLEFSNLPMALVYGAPIAVQVTRRCGTEGSAGASTYTAPRGADIGGRPGAAWRYVLPAPDPAATTRILHVQNAGTNCAALRLIRQSGCQRSDAPDLLTIPPGESLHIAANGTAALTSTAPLAIIVDSQREGLWTSAVAVSVSYDPPGPDAVSAQQQPSRRLVAPLVYNSYPSGPRGVASWGTQLLLRNTSSTTEASPRLRFFDRSGDLITTINPPRICPLGSQVVDFGGEVPPNWIGTIHVESTEWWLPGAMPPDEPLLIGTVTLSRPATGGYPAEAAAYPLLPADGPDVGIVALPDLHKDLPDGEPATDLAIANMSTAPGVTEYGIYLYDTNGLLNVVCQRLGAREMEYIDLTQWSYVNPGWRGTAIVSANYWDHMEVGPNPHVHLGVAVVLSDARLAGFPPSLPPTPVPGKPRTVAWAGAGVPLGVDAPVSRGQRYSGGRPGCPQTPRQPTRVPPTITPGPSPTPRQSHIVLPVMVNQDRVGGHGVVALTETPTPAPSATREPMPEVPGAPYRPRGPIIHLPVLATLDGTGPCAASVFVQNVSAEAVVALLVTWGETQTCHDSPCVKPRSIDCSGLIGPGSSWTWQVDSGQDLSGTLFSLRDVALADIGVPSSPGQSAADAVCAAMQTATTICDAKSGFSAFKSAYDAGLLYGGLPMDRIRGGAIVAEVQRDCAGQLASYHGLDEADAGAKDPANGSFTYTVPLVYLDKAGFNTALYIQNESADQCTAVEVWFKAQDDCLRARTCFVVAIGPGQTSTERLGDCLGSGAQGSLWLRSTGPLAVAVDILGRGALSTYEATPDRVLDPVTGEVRLPGSPVAYGPIAFSEYNGWDTGVQVANLSPDVNAKVKLYFLDRSGDIITTLVDWVCPRGSQTFFLPVIQDLPGAWAGSVRIESQEWWTPGPAYEGPPPISAVVSLQHFTNPERTETTGMAMYNALTEEDSFDWKYGRGAGGLDSGVGLLAIPHLELAPPVNGFGSHLAVTNLVPAPGFTRFNVVLFDNNGTVDELCMQLAEKQTESINLGYFGHLTAGFSGSALVSATYWNHRSSEGADRLLVGLAAASISPHWTNADVPGDEFAISAATPLRGEVARALAALLPHNADCAVDLQRQVLPGPPQRPSAAELGEVFLPALTTSEPGAACAAQVTVQNVGAAPSKVVLIGWKAGDCAASCIGVTAVTCSGLLGPGSSWTFSGPAVRGGTLSGTLFSLAPAAADQVCQALAATVGASNCAPARTFVTAYKTGGSFAGINLASGVGAPIVADVVRQCTTAATYDVTTTAAYAGIAQAERGVATSGLTPPLFDYIAPYAPVGGATDAGWAREASWLYVQNMGTECASFDAVRTPFAAVGTDPETGCGDFDVAPGATVRIDPQACGADPRDGSLRLQSTQPLAIVAESASQEACCPTRSAYEVRASSASSWSTILFAPLTFSEFQGWSTALYVAGSQPAGGSPSQFKVSFLDRSGDKIATLTDWVSPGAARQILFPHIAGLPGNWVGDVLVEGFGHRTPEGDYTGPDVIHAVIRQVFTDDVDGDAASDQAFAYNLLPQASAYLWPVGAGPGGSASGTTVIAVPQVVKAVKDGVGSSEIAIANLVPVPGYTDFAVLWFDQNGLVDFVCQKLNEKQVEYVNLQTWGNINPGFHGSVLISATRWQHPVRDAAGVELRQVVGLGVVSMQRPSAILGTDVIGDELGAMTGHALAAGSVALPPSALVNCDHLSPAPTPTAAP